MAPGVSKFQHLGVAGVIGVAGVAGVTNQFCPRHARAHGFRTNAGKPILSGYVRIPLVLRGPIRNCPIKFPGTRPGRNTNTSSEPQTFTFLLRRPHPSQVLASPLLSGIFFSGSSPSRSTRWRAHPQPHEHPRGPLCHPPLLPWSGDPEDCYARTTCQTPVCIPDTSSTARWQLSLRPGRGDFPCQLAGLQSGGTCVHTSSCSGEEVQ